MPTDREKARRQMRISIWRSIIKTHGLGLVLAFVWLYFVLLAIFPELMLRPVINVFSSMGYWLGILQDISPKQDFFPQWIRSFLQRDSYVFLPLAVIVDLLLVWLLYHSVSNRDLLIVHAIRGNSIFLKLVVVLIVLAGLLGVVLGVRIDKEAIGISSAFTSLMLVTCASFFMKYTSLVPVATVFGARKVKTIDTKKYTQG